VSSNRSLKKSGWRLAAITTEKRLGVTLAMMGVDAHMVNARPGTDARRSRWHVSNDDCMYRIYNRSVKQMKPAVRKGNAS
jgi:hypothetical protein